MRRLLTIWLILVPSLHVLAGEARFPARPAGGKLYVLAGFNDRAQIILPDKRPCAPRQAPGHGSVVQKGKKLTYTPATDYRGADYFSCRMAGSGLLEVGVTVDRISIPAAAETDPVPRQEYDDVRYGFPLDGAETGIVVTNSGENRVSVFGMTPDVELLDISKNAKDIRSNFSHEAADVAGAYVLCLYLSPVSGKFYAFATSKPGVVAQIELRESKSRPGEVTGDVVRTFDVNPGRGSQKNPKYWIEACVADDHHKVVYFAEADVGIWRYGAEPGDRTKRRLIDRTGPPGFLVRGGDVEGLAIYQATESTGYLIASSQDNSSFVIYDRGGANAFVTRFEIVESPAVDAVTETDGIEVVNLDLGGPYASGLFVVQVHVNEAPGEGPQNLKLIPWADIAGAIKPNLIVAPDFDPR